MVGSIQSFRIIYVRLDGKVRAYANGIHVTGAL